MGLPRRHYGGVYVVEEGLYWWELLQLLENKDRQLANGVARSAAEAVTALTTTYRFWFEYGKTVDDDNFDIERLRNVPRPSIGFPTSQPSRSGQP